MNINYFTAMAKVMADYNTESEESYIGASVRIVNEGKTSEYACLMLEGHKGMPKLIAYLDKDGSFELSGKKFRCLEDLQESLNHDYTQINELGEIIELSGWSQGDINGYAIAIDKKANKELIYEEGSDWFTVREHKSEKEIKEELTAQADKLDEVYKVISEYSLLEDSSSFLDSVIQDLRGYIDTLG